MSGLCSAHKHFEPGCHQCGYSNKASDLLLRSAELFDKACILVKEMEDKIENDKYRLDMAENDRDNEIKAAARLANALKDIYNDIGEMPEVKERFLTVETDVDHYSGLENCGE